MGTEMKHIIEQRMPVGELVAWGGIKNCRVLELGYLGMPGRPRHAARISLPYDICGEKEIWVPLGKLERCTS